MSKPLVDRIPFAKILIALAIIFGLSLGLCGLGAALVWSGKNLPAGVGNLLSKAAGWDALIIVLSFVALPITALIWVAMLAVNSLMRKK